MFADVLVSDCSLCKSETKYVVVIARCAFFLIAPLRFSIRTFSALRTSFFVIAWLQATTYTLFELPQGVAAVRVDVSRSHGDLEAGRMVAGACAGATGCGSSLRLSAL